MSTLVDEARTWADRFFVTGGAIIGREHLRLHRNNQDGLAIRRSADSIVAVVTDGCSSGRYSEVGARLGAAWLAARLPIALARRDGQDDNQLARALTDGLVDYLRSVAWELAPSPEMLPAVVADYLLFTFLVAVVEPQSSCIFGMGDGVWGVNGARTVLDPGPENAPAYPAYRLLETHGYPDAERLNAPLLHFRAPTEMVRTLIIGSDGVEDLGPESFAGFGWESQYIRNPMQLQRRLVVLGEQRRLLPDDTSMVLIRRRPRSGGQETDRWMS